ncbi:MAG: contractile injection system protein, VgrG/Pvc8 family, partial [Gammaproteobacteria bacterium]|nr:contractile injection system protein, VgrG/Pvc8 family [Gammaproteobacteria bacterium]
TRLGVDNDAVATVKNGYLLFIQMGEGATANGTPIPGVTINREDGDTHSFQRTNSKQKYSGVKANWLDTNTAQAQTVIAGENGTCKDLKKTYPTAEEAQAAAEAEWRRIQRASVTFSLTLAIGRPELIPEQPVALTGWKGDITSHEWMLGNITHNLDDGGLTTAVTLEPSI